MTDAAAADPELGAPAAPRVVYVMGAGRSGSTILGVTLGNCEGFFYAGELDKWLPRAGVPRPGGEGRARFWEQVGERVDAGALASANVRSLERSVLLFRPRSWLARSRLRARYINLAEELYRAVAATAGAKYIVDTSHYPLRARELQRASGIELYLLFLVRDPHSVIASFGRAEVPERSFGKLAANLYLCLTYLVSTIVFLRQTRERRLLVRHERFVSDPNAVLREILLALDAPPMIPDLNALSTGFPIQGNRLIDNDVVALTPGADSPRSRSLLTAFLQFPWKLVFSRLEAAAGRHES